MPANRNSPINQECYGLGHGCPTLDLHHVRTPFSYQADCILKGALGATLIGAKGHVCNHQRIVTSSGHTLGVIKHVGHRYRQRGLMPLNHHAKAVSDQ